MGSPLDDVKKELVSWLLRQVSNLFEQIIWEPVVCYFRYESNFEELEQYVEDLRQKKDWVERHVEAESKNYSKNIAADVEIWLQQVKNIITEHEVFLEDKALPYTVCSKGFLPRHGIRYRLARTADRLARKVDKLRKTSNFDRVSDGLVPMSIDFILSDIGFESFESRNAVMKKIMEALKDSTVRIIGVCGPGGVGKTTLAKKVASEARKDKLFNVVVVANVTRNPDTRKIQGQLADMMGLRLEEESEIGRASRLRDRFKKEKENTLVILDDLWAGLDLNKLGIPIGDDNLSPNTVKDTFDSKISTEKSRGDSKMVKILLTSRSKEVLSSKMDVKENSIFSMEGLLDKEAEILFKKEARVGDKTAVFEPLAAKISKKCAGLPMAVVTIGRALRDKNYSEWNDALRQLERREFTEVGESVVFSAKLSFDHLENEELKSTFLLCAQMGHHPLIMDLVKFCIGLGIFEGFITIREARERIHTLIGRLKDSSLLMNSYSSDRFNMHDMIRDVALSIASKERHVFTMRNGKLDEWPHNNEFERYSAISLHKCDIDDELPESVSCPRLKIFHVDSLNPSFRIPNNFFGGMKELKALILSGIVLSPLPTSIKCLTNLRLLCLEQCELGDISFIGELQKLRILSLSGSKIENLPTELGQLCKLQLFDISNCSELREIPPNVLSRLNNLEELYMRNSVKWENEGSRSGNAILAELRHLHQLKNLDVCIPNAAVLPRNLFLDKLDRYKFVIGDFETLSVGDFKMPDKYEASRVLALQIRESDLIHSQKGIKMLFSRVEKMLLGQLKGVQNIFYELNLEGFPCLKQLSIASNSDIECIIDSKELSDPKDVFLNLESLCLYNLWSLKKISYSKLTGTSFSKLKVVRINICAQLKNIFSLSMVLLLTNLETIDVSNCDFMEKIVAEEECDMEVKDDQIFPKLRSLALQTLPKLSGVYSNEQGESTDVCLFSEQVAIPNLESLVLSSINIHKIWSSRSKPFKNLISLNVEDCNEIEYLLSFSMARSLMNLKSMSVSRCEKMEEIFKSEGIILHEARKVCVFPKLEEIHLSHMKNLTSIWPIQVTRDSFRSLNSVFIEGCEKLVAVFPNHMVGRFGSLESLTIVNCNLVEVVFELKNAPQNRGGDETHLRLFHINALPRLKHVWNRDPDGILNFKSLHSIFVFGCHDLKYLFPVSVVKGLKELDSLLVLNCPHMEEIARGQGSNASSITFVFPKITHVAIVALPELKSFYKGRHSLKWPKLQKLSVNDCDKLEVFKTETTNSEGGPIFLPEEIISNLEAMAITLKEAERLKHRIKDYCMNCLNSFFLTSCPTVEFLHWFLNRMPYLERLALFECDLREVIPTGSLGTQAKIGTVVQLKSLWLINLHVLENIGFERDPVLQRLEDLYLHGCHKLINLVPSSVTLTHLTSLEVNGCRRLRNLMGFSTANSLAQLMSLKVIGCKMLEEIVAEQNEEEDKITKDHEIVFSKLMTLELVSLPNLSCFCSSEIHAFKFPSLEKLILGDCSMMTKFSTRFTTAPNLQVLERRGERYRYWKGDLKATIQTMFAHTEY